MSGNSESLENLSTENRTFPPSAAFAEQANARSELYAHADKDRLAFWDEQASALNWQALLINIARKIPLQTVTSRI